METVEDYIKQHNLYLISELPNSKQLKSRYINTYLFIKKRPTLLYYITHKGESVTLNVDQKQFNEIDTSSLTDESKSLQLLGVPKESLNKLFDIIMSNKTHIHVKIGGLRGHMQQQITNSLINEKNPYYTSMKKLSVEDGDNKTKFTEIKKAFDDENHPLYLPLQLELASHELEEVARNYDEMSLENLIQTHGETAVKWGAMQYQQNAYRKQAKKYGESGREKRHTEDSLIKKEIIRLYQSNEKLKELRATDIVTKFKKQLIDFMKENNFTKKNYTDRFIAKQIRDFRKVNKIKK